MNEFKSFKKIPYYSDKVEITITQKMDGTNAQINIFEDEKGNIQAIPCSRNRVISVDDDNYGFARFVDHNKEELIELLGVGRHYGEWCGPGIQTGEGLKYKTLFLFDRQKMYERKTVQKCRALKIHPVPLLLEDLVKIEDVNKNILEKFNMLKNLGSCFNGFNNPEGIVVEMFGQLFKYTYEREGTRPKVEKVRKEPTKQIDVSHLLCPIRLKKILGSDQKYTRTIIYYRRIKKLNGAPSTPPLHTS